MLRGVVGDEVFFDILATYRDRFEYGTADTEDLRGVAEEVWGGDLDWFFDQWVYGGGAPAYRYGHREHEIAGDRYLEISIEQTQTEGAFSMPVEVEIGEAGETRRVALWNSASTQHYLVPVSAPVDAFAFDPDAWILTRSVAETAFTDGPPKIVTLDPAPGSVLRVGDPLTMTVIFHEDVVIDKEDISLQRIGGAIYDVEVAYDAASHTATISTQESLAGGRYELILSDTIVDANGLALDGELSAPFKTSALPTGNGMPGGEAVAEFGVTGILGPTTRLQPTG
jgi:hypothetical protein